uniref:IRS-type PTB domain-containing protein n=1 Tax=Macrostomum lignano TaxID=282301 RepID=A0A1I8FLA4_9PLAT
MQSWAGHQQTHNLRGADSDENLYIDPDEVPESIRMHAKLPPPLSSLSKPMLILMKRGAVAETTPRLVSMRCWILRASASRRGATLPAAAAFIKTAVNSSIQAAQCFKFSAHLLINKQQQLQLIQLATSRHSNAKGEAIFQLKTGSDLYLRDDLCAIKVFEKIHQLSLSQQQPDAGPPDREYNVVRPESQVEPVYANEMDPSSSGASPPAVKSPKSPAAKPLPPPSKPPKPKPTKAPKPKPEPKPNNVESPTGDAAGGSYDMNECPYAVLDTESLNKPMPGSQPNRKPKPSLPPTSESDGDQTQQQQPPPAAAAAADII